MIGQPVHRFLEDFTAGTAAGHTPLLALRPWLTAHSPAPVLQVHDAHAEELQQAFDQGSQQAAVAAQAASEAALSAVVAEGQHRIDAHTAVFSDELAARLVRELRDGLASMHAAISANVAATLVPLLRTRFTRDAIDSLAAELSVMVRAADTATIAVRGPADLVERLQRSFADHEPGGVDSGRIQCTSGSDAELTIALNDSVVETRLAEWLERLNEAIL